MRSNGGHSHLYFIKRNVPLIIAKKNSKTCIQIFNNGIQCKHKNYVFVPKPIAIWEFVISNAKKYPKGYTQAY